MTKDELRELVDALKDVARDASRPSGTGPDGKGPDFAKTVAAIDKEIAKFKKAMVSNTGTLEEQTKKIRKHSDAIDNEIKELEKHIELLEEQNDTNSANMLTKKKADLEELKAQAVAKAGYTSIAKTLRDTNTYTGMLNTGIQALAETAKNVVSNLQDGAGPVRTANNILSSGLTLAGKGGTALGSGLEALGQPLSASKSALVKWSGILMSSGGSLLKTFSPQVTAALQFGLEVFGKELTNLGESFSKTSNTGAVFADGLTGLTRASGDSQLNLQQFSKVVTDNAHGMLLYGGTVAGGATKLGEVNKALGKNRESLLSLGFTYEDQAENTSNYLEMLARSGQLAGKSNEELADGSASYMKNLRVISAITGEDAKRLQEKARKDAQEAAVQSKLATMDAEAQTKFMNTVALAREQYGEVGAEYVKQKLVMGTVTGQAALFGASLPTAAQNLDSAVGDISDSTLKADAAMQKNLDLQKKNAMLLEGESKNISNTVGVATMAGGTYRELSEAASKSLRTSQQQQKEGYGDIATVVEDAAKTQDKLTSDYVGAVKANQEAVVAQQKIIFDNMGLYAGMIKTVNEQLAEFVKSLGEIVKSLKDGGAAATFTDKVKGFFSNISGVLEAAVSVATLAGGGKAIYDRVRKNKTPAAPAAGTPVEAPQPAQPSRPQTIKDRTEEIRKQREAEGKPITRDEARKQARADVAAQKAAVAAQPQPQTATPTVDPKGKIITPAQPVPPVQPVPAGQPAPAQPTKGASKVRPKLGAAGGVAGLVGGLTLGYGAQIAEDTGHSTTAGLMDAGSSALTGAGLGAAIGSVVPLLGTAIGGAIGGVIGGGIGLYQNWGKITGDEKPKPTTTGPAPMPAEQPTDDDAVNRLIEIQTQMLGQNAEFYSTWAKVGKPVSTKDMEQIVSRIPVIKPSEWDSVAVDLKKLVSGQESVLATAAYKAAMAESVAYSAEVQKNISVVFEKRDGELKDATFAIQSARNALIAVPDMMLSIKKADEEKKPVQGKPRETTDLASSMIPLNATTKEMRDLLAKQLDRIDNSTTVDKDILAILKQQTALLKQLVDLTA